MKHILLCLITISMVGIGSTANATSNKNETVRHLQDAIHAIIEDLEDESDEIKAKMQGASSYDRKKLYHENKIVKIKIAQMKSLKRIVPYLPEYKLRKLKHVFKMNVSPTRPTV